MAEEISIFDIIVSWFLFWVLTLGGLVLFAGSILVPLWQEQALLVQEYQAVDRQVSQLKGQVDQVNEQLGALWVDPGYTERIARNELNLRKVGEETAAIVPEPVPLKVVPKPTPVPEEGQDAADVVTVPDYRPRWWYKPFLDDQRRTWFLYLSGGLVAAGLIIAITSKDRRFRALGF